MANIILNNEMSISMTKVQEENDILEASFYISKEFSNYDIFAAITDNEGVHDIVPLTFEKVASNYNVYHISPKIDLRIKGGDCKVTVIVISGDFYECKSATLPQINFNIDNYILCHHTYLNKKLSTDIANYYEKIVKMTKLNIDIYTKLSQEGLVDED